MGSKRVPAQGLRRVKRADIGRSPRWGLSRLQGPQPKLAQFTWLLKPCFTPWEVWRRGFQGWRVVFTACAS